MQSEQNHKGLIAVVCSVLGLLSFGFPPIPTILSIVAIVLGNKALKDANDNHGLAKVGKILGWIGVIISIAYILFIVGFFVLLGLMAA